MHKISQLKNGLTLITVDLPHLDSVTSLLAVAAGSRYETRKINGISHFLEHMFFKGSIKYPSAEQIATLVDSIGAINNAATDKEVTFYWIKSAAKHIELASDILSSMLKDPLLSEEEIEREKGVIVEELRMYRDNPASYIGWLFERLQFGDTPLGWNVGGEKEIITSLNRGDFINYMQSLYSPKSMALVFAGNVPKNIESLAEKYFSDLPAHSHFKYQPFKKTRQSRPRINIFYKKTDQANLILGVEGYDRQHQQRFAAKLLGVILGEGMSSRLFIQVRERRGLAYSVSAGHSCYQDSGVFSAYAGLKLEKIAEGLEVIKAEMDRMAAEKVSEEELKKGQELIRGRLAISSESTNFLAQYFGIEYVLNQKIETFGEYLKNIDAVTREDIQNAARQLFKKDRLNLQIIGPFKNADPFRNILNK